MGKIAFVFSGQGDQSPGMGKDIAEKYSAASSVYEMCDRLRPGTSSQCFEGTEEELKETSRKEIKQRAREYLANTTAQIKILKQRIKKENLS